MRRLYIICGLAITTLLGLVMPSPRESPHLVVLDVGQGDALYIRTPAGSDILIDTGPGYAVVPELLKHMPTGDKKIELLILTHLDADHVGGTTHVFDAFTVDVFATNGERATTKKGTAALEAGEQALAQVQLGRGQRIVQPGLRIDVLWPGEDTAREKNEGSLVLRLRTKKESILLTGDIPASTEAAIIDDMQWVKTKTLKVSHHGSSGSSSETFLRANQARIGIISAGIPNRYGHPAEETLTRLAAHGVEIRKNNTDKPLVIPL